MTSYPALTTSKSGSVQSKNYDLCRTTNASFQHILSGCKAAQTQDQFRWRHEQVLRKLAEVAEKRKLEANKESPAGSRKKIIFLKQGEPPAVTRKTTVPKLLTGLDWKMEGGLGR